MKKVNLLYPSLLSQVLSVFMGCFSLLFSSCGLVGDVEQTKYVSSLEVISSSNVTQPHEPMPVAVSSEVPVKLLVKDQFSKPLSNEKMLLEKIEGIDVVDFPSSVFTDDHGMALFTIKTSPKEGKVKFRAKSLSTSQSIDIHIETFVPFVLKDKKTMLRDCSGQNETVGDIYLNIVNSKDQPLSNVGITFTIQNGKFSNEYFEVPKTVYSDDQGKVHVSVESSELSNTTDYNSYLEVSALLIPLDDLKVFQSLARVTRNAYLKPIGSVIQTQYDKSASKETRFFRVQALASCDKPVEGLALEISKSVVPCNPMSPTQSYPTVSSKTDARGEMVYALEIIFSDKNTKNKYTEVRIGKSSQGFEKVNFVVNSLSCFK